MTEEVAEDDSPAARSALLAAGAVGLAFVVLLLAVAFNADTRVTSSNSKVKISRYAVEIPPRTPYCQRTEFVPADTRSIRLYPGVERGHAPPPLAFTLEQGDVHLAWTYEKPYRVNVPLEVPIPAPPRTLDDAELCFTNLGTESVFFAGNLTPLSPDAPIGPSGFGRRNSDEVRIDYLRPTPRAVVGHLGRVADHFAAVKPSFVGPWTLWVLFAAAIAMVALAIRLVVRAVRDPERSFRGRLPAAARWCVAITFAHCAVWAVLTPGFQVPDELVHVQYSTHLGTSGRFPVFDPKALDRDFRQDKQDEVEQHFRAVPFSAEGQPQWSRANERKFDAALRRGLPPASPAGARNAASNPPLYYAYEGAVARVVEPLRPEDRLLAMRLASGLVASLTALFAFLFVRETLPSNPVAAVVGGMAVGLHPLLGFVGGGVNNDNLLIALATGVFYVLARSFRRGLTPARGLALGLLIGGGLLTKTRIALLLPMVAVGLVAMIVIARRKERVIAVGGAATAGVTVVAINSTWRFLSDAVFHRTAESSVASQADTSGKAIDQMLSYAWQYFLPRLPFMSDQFLTWPQYGLWEVYFVGFVGRFGWFQYEFPPLVNHVALAVVIGLVGLATAAVLRARRVLVGRRGIELLTYLGLFLSSLFFLALAGYRYRADTTFNLEQTRYVFPCIAVYAGVVALAVRGAGRWHAVVAGGLVALFGGHAIAAMFLTVLRYYA